MLAALRRRELRSRFVSGCVYQRSQGYSLCSTVWVVMGHWEGGETSIENQKNTYAGCKENRKESAFA